MSVRRCVRRQGSAEDESAVGDTDRRDPWQSLGERQHETAARSLARLDPHAAHLTSVRKQGTSWTQSVQEPLSSETTVDELDRERHVPRSDGHGRQGGAIDPGREADETGFAVGMVTAPRLTRMAAYVLTAETISDFLQLGYRAAEERASS